MNLITRRLFIKHLPVFLSLCMAWSYPCAQTVTILEQGQPCSIRGLSVVDNDVAWVSASNGYIGLTLNGGQTWAWQQVKGFEKSDFRDIEAFSAQKAVIMSSGTPALVMTTADGGLHWHVNFRNDDKAWFLDAMDFADDSHGYILGDPIDGKFTMLKTKNGGANWDKMPNPPQALPGEAAFAASGTCISARDNLMQVVTGGSNARLLTWTAHDKAWSAQPLPLLHGKDAQGAFSFAGHGTNTVVVGGDYQHDARADSVTYVISYCCYVPKMAFPQHSPAGFQSCVAYVGGNAFLSTGTPGTNITVNGGYTWKQIDRNSFNVCQKAKHGNLVLLAGEKGKIARFENYQPDN